MGGKEGEGGRRRGGEFKIGRRRQEGEGGGIRNSL